MRIVRNLLLVAVFGALFIACPPSQETPVATPPVAKVVPQELTIHDHTRIDNYYWLRERENQEVIDYLTAENEYTAAMMSGTADLEKQIYQEIVGRIKQDDSSAPYLEDGYYYYTRYEEGKEYPLYCRKAGSLEAPEQVMVDANIEAEGHNYCSVTNPDVSPMGDIAVYGVDTVSRRKYTLKFKNLSTNEMLADEIKEVTPNTAWANDNKTLFYTKQHPDTLRSYQIYRHVLGADPATDVLVYEETDDTFSCYIFKTKSEKYLMIGSTHTLSSEYRYLDADNPTGEFKIVQPRQRDLEYDVDHFGNDFYIVTNLEAKNFRLMKTPVTKTELANWVEVVPHREDVLLQGIEIFKDYLVLSERANGLTQIRIKPWKGEEHYLDFGEPAYVARIGVNRTFDTPYLRFNYTSLTTPNSVYDYRMDTKERTLVKQDEVLGGYDPTAYTTERLTATATDGTAVPISLVYKNDLFKHDGSNPMLLYAYGSYGSSTDPNFSSVRLSLIDRGFVYAIAHIRGGSEMGRQWYEDGKLLKKINTFTDFIDCAHYLVEQKYTSVDKLFAQGGSAGGLLMGAVANMAPESFKGIIAQVPFVDVVTTMLDASIPLTTSEYDEWGNPNDKTYYDYMLSYSPYDQVEKKAYPALLVTTGLHDSQVQYWEPAKWVAKLRVMKTDKNPLLLKTNMEAGHGGASGRFQRFRETAFVYTFILQQLGMTE